MLRVEDASVGLTRHIAVPHLRLGGAERGLRLPRPLVQKLLLHLLIDQHVVWSDAHLPAVHDVLEQQHARHCQADLGGPIDEDGALATTLERHRRQVARRGRHHHFAHPRGACVDDVVELELQQRRRLRHAALNQTHRVGREVLWDELRQERGGGRG
eukprot:scaffold4328_cov135-Isochrysis_galbana.AAC.2